MKLSICIVCKERSHHLKQTLPQNLLDTEKHGSDVEFVLLDYNSTDGLEEWILGEMIGYIKSGRLTYWKEKTAKFFRLSHAKNLAVSLGSNDIMMSFDADCFLGPDYIGQLLSCFDKEAKDYGNANVIVQMGFGWLGGEIAVTKENWHSIRGFDETFEGWGYEDVDFYYRAVGPPFNLKPVFIPMDHRKVHIIHSIQDRTGYYENVVPHPYVSCEENYRKSLSRPIGSMINPQGYGEAVVYRNFDPIPARVAWGEGMMNYNPEPIFTNIITTEAWSKNVVKETVCGPGSTVHATSPIVEKLPKWFGKFYIRSVHDLGCGDFNWMKLVDLSKVTYDGYDVIKSLVDKNSKDYFKEGSVRFHHLDILQASLAYSDLVICKDVFNHLPTSYVMKILLNIRDAGSKFLASNTFPGALNHLDTTVGGWHMLDFTKPPFSLGEPLDFVWTKDYPVPKIFAIWNIAGWMGY